MVKVIGNEAATSVYIDNNSNITYKVVNGTYYHEDTNDKIVNALEHARNSRKFRLKIYYGDTKTGRAWGDISVGYIGRSTGMVKIPLLIKNSRSMGGEGLLDHCIVKIEYANKKNGGVIYVNKNFHE